ncbi:hypothetical protein L21SP4_00739 [Kiritimatiella glycovorans]|uniref:Uncharacterized protein n=2 Tax=Kiritimatiella glycovorans TaxID=1307763 RepID=A0A0G3EF02_9BACT|nr:hypothetical protein L21SP4_00739 [Kiritimatiella glycovorans]
MGIAGCASVWLTASASASEMEIHDWGPFWYECRTASGAVHRTAAGPFYEHRAEPGAGSMTAWRPFRIRIKNAKEGTRRTEYVWPLYVRRIQGEEETGRGLVFLFSRDFDRRDEDGRRRRWLIPFYFDGIDEDGEPYLGVFPLGGSVHDFLGQERFSWLLFPLYLEREGPDGTARTVLWPVFSRTRGDGLRRDRLFPLCGRAVKEGAYEKSFLLWPVWTHARYEREHRSGEAWMLFPFAGGGHVNDERTRYVLPPFFRYTERDGETILHAPWPFVQRQQGGRTRRAYLWPLYGWKETPGIRSEFFFWPVVRSKDILHAGERVRHVHVLPFLYWRAEGDASVTGDSGPWRKRRLRIWPFFRHTSYNGKSCFRAPALSPFPDLEPIERHYAPFWTLYEAERGPRPGEVRRTALWGLFRRRGDGEGSWRTSVFPLFEFGVDREEEERAYRWSVLKGLIGYDSDRVERPRRILYIFRF